MWFSKSGNLFVVLVMTAILTSGVALALRDKTYVFGQSASVSNTDNTIVAGDTNQNNTIQTPSTPLTPLPQKLSDPPAIIKAIYITGYSAGSKSYIKYVGDLLKNTEINAVVVDIKGSDGYVTYASGAPDVAKYNLSDKAIPDIDALVKFFHGQNIYVIGRIAGFEDPVYAAARPELAVYDKSKTTDLSKPVLWQDNNGLSWLDPSSKDVWDYDISLAKDAFNNGFDEVNFDYVRFPTDGATGNMGFPVYDAKTSMADTIKDFFHYVRTSLPDEKISVDLFGLTTVATDDMGIGQLVENAFENFDYVAPMVYPSHFADGFITFANPADHPYDVIKYSMDSAVAKENNFAKQRQDLATESTEAFGSPASLLQALTPPPTPAPLAKYRPWLQDFNLGADYTSDMIKQEIKATQDSLGSDYSGFMLWNPENIYMQDAVIKDTTTAK